MQKFFFRFKVLIGCKKESLLQKSEGILKKFILLEYELKYLGDGI